jgi:hypothetical protein
MRWQEPLSFASLTDVVMVSMEQWSMQRCEFIVEKLFLKKW